MEGKSCGAALLAQWRLFAFVLVPLSCLPLPIFWNTDSGKTAYILVIASVFMVFEVLPLAITTIFSLFLIPMTGIQSLNEASKAFANDFYFLFMGIVVLAVAIEEVNLHKRLALLTLRFIGASPSRLIFGFLHISGLLSMWMANTAVTLMILPIAIAISETLTLPEDKQPKRRSLIAATRHPQSDTLKRIGSAYGYRYPTSSFEDELFLPDAVDGNVLVKQRAQSTVPQSRQISPKRLSKVLQLSVAYGSNIGGIATLVGSHPNIILRMTVEMLYKTDTGLNFMSYFVICAPVALVSLFFIWILFSLMYIPRWCRCGNSTDPLNKEHDERRQKYLEEQYEELGPLKQAEVSVLLTFLIVIALWLTRTPQVFHGWSTALPDGLSSDCLPTLFAVVVLFVWPADFAEFATGVHRPILTWKAAQAKVPWELLIFQGGLTILSTLAQDTGLTTAMGNQVPDLRDVSPRLVVVVICIVTSALTEVANNSVIAAMFIPVLANVAEDSGVNPLYYMMAATIACMFSFMVPISSFPTIVVYGHGTVSRKDMLVGGTGPKIICILVLIASLEFLGGLVLADWNTNELPVWASAHYNGRIGTTNSFENTTLMAI